MRVWLLVGLASVLGACAGGDCEDADAQCAGDVLQTCVDGAWEDSEDCAASGLMCHQEMGHCMEMDSGGS